ncbi:MAG: Trp family transcriptional regulator [Patescibacteria group bacterium]
MIWRGFIEEIKKVEIKEDTKKTINRFLTSSEQIMLEKRLAILYLLGKRLSFRQIQEFLDVTRNTIGFVKNGFVKKKKSLLKKNWRHPILDKLDKREFPPKFPTYKGRGRWRFLNG